MRVPPDHLAGDRFHHVAEVEGILLLGHSSVKHHLQQEITKLLAQILEIATREHKLRLALDALGNLRPADCEDPGCAASR